MTERFELYLADVSRRLHRIDENRRTEIVAELRAHLILSQRSGIDELGMSEEESARAALRSLGATRNVAEDLVRQETGTSTRSSWRLVRWAILADLAFTWSVLLISLSPGSYLGPSSLAVVALLMPLAPAIFAVAVNRSRRWLLFPMAASVLLSGLLCAVVGSSSWYAGRVAAATASLGPDHTHEAWLRRLDRELALAKSGAEGLSRDPNPYRYLNGYRAPKWVESESRFVLAYIPVSLPGPTTRQLQDMPVPTVAEAARLWRTHGREWVAQLERQRADGLRPASEWPRLGDFLRMMLLDASLRIVQLAAVNGLILAWFKRRRHRLTRRDPHLA